MQLMAMGCCLAMLRGSLRGSITMGWGGGYSGGCGLLAGFYYFPWEVGSFALEGMTVVPASYAILAEFHIFQWVYLILGQLWDHCVTRGWLFDFWLGGW